MQLNLNQMCINMKNLNKVAACFCAIALGLLLSSTAAQADSTQKQTADQYVDSMHSWGSWELGVEPAAGGPVALPNNAVSNRSANIHFRPNDNRVYALKRRGTANVALNPTPAPIHVPPTVAPGVVPTGTPISW